MARYIDSKNILAANAGSIMGSVLANIVKETITGRVDKATSVNQTSGVSNLYQDRLLIIDCGVYAFSTRSLMAERNVTENDAQ